MLFDFQQKQNAKKPNSVHAAYLITGTPRALNPANGLNDRDGEDAVMRSSPFMSSMPEQEEPVEDPVKKTAILLVREEELESNLHQHHLVAPKLIIAKKPAPSSKMNCQSIYIAWSLDQSRYAVETMRTIEDEC